jgi:hypothetical protein
MRTGQDAGERGGKEGRKEGKKGGRKERREGGEGESTGRREGRNAEKERGSAVTAAETGISQSSLEYTRPSRGSDTLAGCDSPPTGSAAVVQQVCLFNI